MIGIDKIVNLMTPGSETKKGTPKKMATNNEAQLDKKMETDLTDIELYLPKKKLDGRVYTLVLDLDETLIHFDPQTRQFRSRPFCLSFLRQLAPYYEIVVFTAATKNYADQIIDALDPDKTLIDFRLYRQHTKPQDGVYYKDLKPLGRDLKKTIIVDNIADNFANQKENGIEIKGWYFEKDDTELKKLQQFFLQLALSKVEDVRPILKFHQVRSEEKVERERSPLVTRNSNMLQMPQTEAKNMR